MNQTSHPVYLSDLASSDFYLFGYLNQILVGSEFAD
jgi:hypothetical protein